MSQEHNMRRVTAIRNGTVIDHIPAGQAMRVLEMLGINKGTSVPVSLVMNVPSKKMGTKDIIKVEDRELNQDELNVWRSWHLTHTSPLFVRTAWPRN